MFLIDDGFLEGEVLEDFMESPVEELNSSVELLHLLARKHDANHEFEELILLQYFLGVSRQSYEVDHIVKELDQTMLVVFQQFLAQQVGDLHHPTHLMLKEIEETARDVVRLHQQSQLHAIKIRPLHVDVHDRSLLRLPQLLYRSGGRELS